MPDEGTKLDSYEAVIADLESKIAVLRATIDNLQSIRAMASQIPAMRTANTQPSGTTAFGHDAFFGMTVADAAKKYLAAIKKTASTQTIGEALIAGGWKTASKNIPETIRGIIGRHADFVRINGQYGLAEWYPGRKVAKRQTSTTNAAAEGTDASDSEETSSESQPPSVQ